MVTAALSGKLKGVTYAKDPIFGLSIPQSCPDVPVDVFSPRSTWPNPAAYDAKAKHLAGLFTENFVKFDRVSGKVAAAGPRRCCQMAHRAGIGALRGLCPRTPEV